MKPKNYAIFVCAHKPIENEIPKGDEYIIVAQNDSIKDDNHKVIYLTDDKFTQDHWRCYSEGCAMRYLWKHPELLPDYVGIAHYRRFFIPLIGSESRIPTLVNKYKAIIMNPFIHRGPIRVDNWTTQCADHFEEDATILKRVVRRLYPDFAEVYDKMLVDNKQYGCNMFVMKRQDFLEMCEICFNILAAFDRQTGLINNDAVYRKIMERHRNQRILGGINWQARLQGFYLEWLTDTYYRYMFDIRKCIKMNIGLPDNSINNYNTPKY